MHSDDHVRPRAVAALAVLLVSWGANPLFIKYLSGHYDAWTQNMFRYGTAALILLAMGRIGRGRRLRLSAPQWRKVALAAACNVAMQVTFATMYYYLYPSVGTLIARANVVVTVSLSALFFVDERRLIRQPRFLVGATLSLVGVVGVILGQNAEELRRLDIDRTTFWIGVAWVLANAFFISCYTLAIKRLVRDVDPVHSFRHVAWITALVLIALGSIFGDPSDVLSEGTTPVLVMLATALTGIVIGHLCYYTALREIKASVAVSMMQTIPLITCTISALWFGDMLSPFQIVAGAAVLGGAWLVALTQARLSRSPQTVLRGRGV